MPFSYAHNPILADTTFVPDVEAHVWADGRIYLYGSFDFQGVQSYCSDRYHVYSSDNMVDWVDHGVAFTIADSTWSKPTNALYAPDCAYYKGKYYLYYCTTESRCGVAVSDKPYGPFKDLGRIEYVIGIDPAVFVDDDGQAYLYWGQFDQVRVAKLKDNMTEIDPETMIQPLSVAEHEFHEGSSMRKINGKYYYLFTDTHRHGNRATSLGYAVSDNPMTGFKYQGIIVDNFGCDPHTWNNHGSIECFHGQWYIFYHRSTYDSEFSRHVCVEKIEVDPAGKIAEVRMTSSGPAAALPVTAEIPAIYACTLEGTAYLDSDSISGHPLVVSHMTAGSAAVYRSLQFNGENAWTVSVKAKKESRLELYVDGWYWTSVKLSAEPKKYKTYTVAIPPITGIHEVTIKCFGDSSHVNMDRFTFTHSETETEK